MNRILHPLEESRLEVILVVGQSHLGNDIYGKKFFLNSNEVEKAYMTHSCMSNVNLVKRSKYRSGTCLP